MKSIQFIITAVITFIVIMIWLVADIIHTQADIPVSSKLKEAITPLDSSFDQTTLDEISKRENIEDQINQLPQETPTPVSSPTAELDNTP